MLVRVVERFFNPDCLASQAAQSRALPRKSPPGVGVGSELATSGIQPSAGRCTDYATMSLKEHALPAIRVALTRQEAPRPHRAFRVAASRPGLPFAESLALSGSSDQATRTGATLLTRTGATRGGPPDLPASP